MPSSVSHPVTTSAPSSSPMVAMTSSKLNHPATRKRMTPPCQAGARAAAGGSVLGVDQVAVLGAPLDPAADEPAPTDDGVPPAAHVVQGSAHQVAAQPGVLLVVVDLGVGEHHPAALAFVGRQAQQPVAVPDLVAAVLGGVGDRRLHACCEPRARRGLFPRRVGAQDSRRAAGGEVTVSVPGTVRSRSRQAATTAAPTAPASSGRISAIADPPKPPPTIRAPSAPASPAAATTTSSSTAETS